MLGPSVIINLWQWFHQHSVKVLVLFIEEVEGEKKRNKTVFPQIFFIAQFQVAQQYSSLTAQNNSVTGTRRHRSNMCIWKLDPMSHQQTVSDYFEVFGTFFGPQEILSRGGGIRKQVQCHKKSNM